MTLIIRPTVSADRPAMLRLWREAWTAAMPDIDFEARLSWFQDHLVSLEQRGADIIAATRHSVVIGFATVDAEHEELDQLVCSIGAQRQGVGRALLAAAQARSPNGLRLKVNQVNEPAIRLYRALGFAVIREGTAALSGLPTFEMRWAGLNKGQARSSAR